jgi:hypothetical protein
MSITTGYLGSRLVDRTDWYWDNERVSVDDCRKFGRANWDHECSEPDYQYTQWGIRTDDGEVIVCWTDPTG